MSNYNYNYRGPSPGPGPDNPGPNRSGGNDDWVDTVSWIVDVGLIFAWFPVGLFLTIANARGHNFIGDLIRSFTKGSKGGASNVRVKTGYDVGQNRTTSSRVYGAQGQNAQGAQPGYSQPGEQTGAEPAREQPQAEAAQKTDGKKTGNDGIRRADAGAKLREIFGWIVGVMGILATIGSMGDGLWSVLSGVAILLGGGALLWSARTSKRKEAAFRRCITVSGDKGVVKLKGLAKTLGMTEEDVEKQLEEMIDRGYYGAKAYIDHARGLLVIDPAEMRTVYQAEDEAKAEESKQKTRAAAKASMTEYDKIIQQIRQADEEIVDEVMSEKIRTMQEITAAIFQEVEAHPGKKPQIQRFMNYYLPTTLKLLDSYARIEQQGVSGENMAKAKADIERIADTLVEGYKKQLDTLYQSEAVDIAGDVSVIENMMKRDGLTGQDDFRIKPEKKTAEAEAPAAETEPQGQVLGGH